MQTKCKANQYLKKNIFWLSVPVKQSSFLLCPLKPVLSPTLPTLTSPLSHSAHSNLSSLQLFGIFFPLDLWGVLRRTNFPLMICLIRVTWLFFSFPEWYTVQSKCHVTSRWTAWSWPLPRIPSCLVDFNCLAFLSCSLTAECRGMPQPAQPH